MFMDDTHLPPEQIAEDALMAAFAALSAVPSHSDADTEVLAAAQTHVSEALLGLHSRYSTFISPSRWEST